MGRKKHRKNAAPARVAAPSRRSAYAALAAIVLVAAVMRLWRIDSAVGGFHAFNEAFYTLLAKNFSSVSLLDPTPDGKTLFLETPPMFPWLLYAVYKVTGVSIVAGRLVSVAASLGTIVVVFLLGAELFGTTEGLVAALVMASAPVAVLTGRNVQTDTVLLLFITTALLFYWRAEVRPGRDRLLFGVFFGLALLTKSFAVIVGLGLVIWELLSTRRLLWIRSRERWIAAGTALGGLVLYYGYHAVAHFAQLKASWIGGAGRARSLSQGVAELGGILPEAFWAFSPAIALLVLAGLLACLRRPGKAALFVLVQLVLFLCFFFFVHKHSYYLLTALPWGALLAGRVFAKIQSRVLRIGVFAVVGISSIFVSLIDLTSMKFGFKEFEDLGREARGLPGSSHVLLADRALWESYSPLVWLLDPRASLSGLEEIPTEPDGRLLLPTEDVYLLQFVPPQTTKPPVGWLFSRERFGLTLFGWTLAEAHPNPNFFRQGRYVAKRTGGPLDFGASVLRVYPALLLVPLPPEVALYRTSEGLALKAR